MCCKTGNWKQLQGFVEAVDAEIEMPSNSGIVKKPSCSTPQQAMMLHRTLHMYVLDHCDCKT